MTNQTIEDLFDRGTTTPDIARLVLGGPFGTEPIEESARRLDHFVAIGGRLVETAHSYKEGAAERAIGAWIADHPRSVGVLTKVGHDPVTKGDIPLEPSLVEEHVRGSLEALNIDRADILLYHTDDPTRTVDELADTLIGLVDRGLAAHVGASNWAPERFAELARRLRDAGHTPIASYQYGLGAPNPELLRPGNLAADAATLAMLDDLDAPLFAWSAQAGGYFSRTADSGPTRSTIFESPENYAKRERTRALAADLGTEPGILALAWTLRRSNTWAAIGPRTTDQLDGSVAALALALTDAQAHWLATGEDA